MREEKGESMNLFQSVGRWEWNRVWTNTMESGLATNRWTQTWWHQHLLMNTKWEKQTVWAWISCIQSNKRGICMWWTKSGRSEWKRKSNSYSPITWFSIISHSEALKPKHLHCKSMISDGMRMSIHAKASKTECASVEQAPVKWNEKCEATHG